MEVRKLEVSKVVVDNEVGSVQYTSIWRVK